MIFFVILLSPLNYGLNSNYQSICLFPFTSMLIIVISIEGTNDMMAINVKMN